MSLRRNPHLRVINFEEIREPIQHQLLT
jgi:hypothetical protein